MNHKHVELFFGSAICMVLYLAIFLLVAGLVMGGLIGFCAALLVVGVLLGLAVLVLGLVPLTAAILVTYGKRLVGNRSVQFSDTWTTCAGCTLIVVSYGGGLACVYNWLVRPIFG
jgi:hypothetical protein